MSEPDTEVHHKEFSFFTDGSSFSIRERDVTYSPDRWTVFVYRKDRKLVDVIVQTEENALMNSGEPVRNFTIGVGNNYYITSEQRYSDTLTPQDIVTNPGLNPYRWSTDGGDITLELTDDGQSDDSVYVGKLELPQSQWVQVSYTISALEHLGVVESEEAVGMIDNEGKSIIISRRKQYVKEYFTSEDGQKWPRKIVRTEATNDYGVTRRLTREITSVSTSPIDSDRFRIEAYSGDVSGPLVKTNYESGEDSRKRRLGQHAQARPSTFRYFLLFNGVILVAGAFLYFRLQRGKGTEE